MSCSSSVAEKDITDDEAKLYDRQIRLWGVPSQKRLRQANVVCFGFSGVASETVKNIVLAGVNSVTVVDSSPISEDDTLSNLFTRHEIGRQRGETSIPNIKLLNPMVQVDSLVWNIEERVRNKDEELLALLAKSDCVFITNFDPDTMVLLNDLCRSITNRTIKFFAASDWGFYAFTFTDLGKNYRYITEEIIQSDIEADGPQQKKQKTEEAQKNCVEKELDFVPLRVALAAKSGKAGIGITKRTSPVLALIHILLKFFKKMNRYPKPESRKEDVALLEKLKGQVLEELELPSNALKDLDESCFNLVFGELSPVSAIVGGVLGQDIIRAITCHDAPIRNFFLLDGVKCQGYVESIGK